MSTWTLKSTKNVSSQKKKDKSDKRMFETIIYTSNTADLQLIYLLTTTVDVTLRSDNNFKNSGSLFREGTSSFLQSTTSKGMFEKSCRCAIA